jgi:hypothetical protein
VSSLVATDYPDWFRAFIAIPAPVAPPQTGGAGGPTVQIGTDGLGPGTESIGANWQKVWTGDQPIMWFNVSNPRQTDGTQADSKPVPQDSVWIAFVPSGGTPPTNGDVTGIYLPSPGFFYCDNWFGDVYMCKAGEIAGDPTITFTLVISTESS